MNRSSITIPLKNQRSVSADLYIPEIPGDDVALSILCHGFTAHRRYSFFPELGRSMCSSGFITVVIDFPGNGFDVESAKFVDLESFSKNTFEAETEVLSLLINYFSEDYQGGFGFSTPKEIFLLGHSRGGVAVMMNLNEKREKVRAASVWAAPSNVVPERFGVTPEVEQIWRAHGILEYPVERIGASLPLSLSVLEDMRRDPHRIQRVLELSNTPLFVAHGTRDESIPVECGRSIAKWCTSSEYLEVDSDHQFEYGTSQRDVYDSVQRKTLEFFRRHSLVVTKGG